MIIVPTEKQFDWKHAPLTLFSIVLINVLVFFLYQSGDTERSINALNTYQDHEFLELEWPLFVDYLETENRLKQLEESQQMYEEHYDEELIVQILLNQEFFDYAKSQLKTQLTLEEYEDWEFNRQDTQSQFDSLSFVAHGLSAANFSIPAILTHQFLHGGIMHLLGNMFFLVICGFAVEAAIGHLRFLLFYLTAGIGAGLAQVASDMSSTVPLVGASGAISGVMAMYLAAFKMKRIEFFYWIFFFVGYFRAPALLILPFYIGKELFNFYANPDSNVAFLAHAGGFITGGILIGLAYYLNPKVFNREYIETDTTIDPAQEKLAEIYTAIGLFRFEQAFKLVNEQIKEHGLSFELGIIRHNLLKITKGKSYKQSALQLLRLKTVSPGEVIPLERIWEENTDLHNHLDDEALILLGMRFSALESPASAELVFNILEKRQCHLPGLALFAKKLATIFGGLGELKKQEKYNNIAKDAYARGQHGTL